MHSEKSKECTFRPKTKPKIAIHPPPIKKEPLKNIKSQSPIKSRIIPAKKILSTTKPKPISNQPKILSNANALKPKNTIKFQNNTLKNNLNTEKKEKLKSKIVKPPPAIKKKINNKENNSHSEATERNNTSIDQLIHEKSFQSKQSKGQEVKDLIGVLINLTKSLKGSPEKLSPDKTDFPLTVNVVQNNENNSQKV